MKASATLRKLLEGEEILVAPGGFSPLCARLAEKVGFSSLYLSGYGVAAYRCGFADVGLMTMNENLENARATCAVTSLPVIVDIDTGYGNAISVKRTVREFERSGVAAVQIEDQAWPKRCGHMEGKKLISAEEMVQKVRAAVDAKTDADLVIVARSDANTVLGFDETIRRLNLYADAGADVLFFESPLSLDEMERIPGLLKKPAFINMSESAKTPIVSNRRLQEMGYKIVIWPSTATWGAAAAIERLYSVLRDKGTTEDCLGQLYTFSDFNKLTGLDDIIRDSTKYSC
nr:isocitrate lyase/phosphoenolpyruvate mutase family protein [uncultured Oscillibacter sp.]